MYIPPANISNRRKTYAPDKFTSTTYTEEKAFSQPTSGEIKPQAAHEARLIRADLDYEHHYKIGQLPEQIVPCRIVLLVCCVCVVCVACEFRVCCE